jgi:hypothetical protein
MVGFDGLIPALKNRLIENLKNHIGQVSKPWFFARTKALGSASPMKKFYKRILVVNVMSSSKTITPRMVSVHE